MSAGADAHLLGWIQAELGIVRGVGCALAAEVEDDVAAVDLQVPALRKGKG